MPPPYVRTIREEILYEYAKLISRSAYGSLQRGFITDRFKKLRDGQITISGTMRDWEREQELPKQCVFCAAIVNLTTDHLIPRSRGGDDSADNVVLACEPCNASRGDKGIFEWLGLKEKDKLHRLVAGKYLKQLLALHEKANTLEIRKDQITILCERCGLPKVCERWGTVRELTCFCLEVVIDAFRGANKLKAITLKPFNKWYIYLIIFLIGNVAIRPLLGWAIRNHIARPYKIPSSGMSPALLVGDRLVADMRNYKSQKPQRGDIIIFEFPKDPSKDFIKRVIGMEGEKVEIVKNKIYINDKLLDDPWGHFTMPRSSIEDYGPVRVPEDLLFVLGDNRDNSMDSRFFGFINIEKVKGKALYLYWAKDKSRIGMELK